jgi:hypothetical protein
VPKEKLLQSAERFGIEKISIEYLAMIESVLKA